MSVCVCVRVCVCVCMCVYECVWMCVCVLFLLPFGGCGDHVVFACQFGLSCGLKDEF